jgi:hypothetical protein
MAYLRSDRELLVDTLNDSGLCTDERRRGGIGPARSR